MRRIMSSVAGALALVGIAATLTACGPTINCSDLKSRFGNSKATQITNVDDAEKTVFCLTNDERTSRGLAAYTWNAKLATAARKHANAAVAQKWWDGRDPHVNPIGNTTPTSRVRAEGYCPSGSYNIGENVYTAWGNPVSFADTTPRDAVAAWMASTQGHREAILSTTYKELGVGVAKGSPEPANNPNAAVFVQNFGRCT